MVDSLRAENLTLAWDVQPVVHEVSLELAAGEFLAVLGENGAGKSTLLKGMAGLLPPRSGRVLLQEKPVGDLKPRSRARKLAVLPQTMAYLAGITVRDFVTQGRYIHRPSWHSLSADDTEAIEKALKRSDLSDLAERALDSLSGGERQRAALARALAQDTPFLLVDEPTAALDGRHQIWAFRRLRELCDEGRGILVVTHELNLASQFADRILLMCEGRVLALGHPRDVLTAPNLSTLLGQDFLTGRATSCSRGEERPWFIPWWQGEGDPTSGPCGEDPGPEGRLP